MLSFDLSTPRKLVLQVEGRKPLAILATSYDNNIPAADDPGVIFFAARSQPYDVGVVRPANG